jgi:hypothetical protein
MQMPISSDPIREARHNADAGVAIRRSGLVLSLESQLRLRALYDYVEASRAALADIETDFSLLETDPSYSLSLKRAAERLRNFCMEADSRGFNFLYDISMGLQLLLVDSEGKKQGNAFLEALHRGIATLSALLDHCEGDFRCRLLIADTLDCINRASSR